MVSQRRVFSSHLLFLGSLVLSCPMCLGEELVLEDYQGGGAFNPAPWANEFRDADGNANAAHDAGDFAAVQWATKWSGLPSSGPKQDLSRFKTFQVDVMVDKGEPIELGTNFYFQLIHEVPQGYSYWEMWVPQSKIPADAHWYRVKFRLDEMNAVSGDGATKPSGFQSIVGAVCGMTFDDEPDKYKLKRASFDNLVLSDEEIPKTTVQPAPKSVNSRSD